LRVAQAGSSYPQKNLFFLKGHSKGCGAVFRLKKLWVKVFRTKRKERLPSLPMGEIGIRPHVGGRKANLVAARGLGGNASPISSSSGTSVFRWAG